MAVKDEKDEGVAVEYLIRILSETRQLMYECEKSLSSRKKHEGSFQKNEERYRIHFSLANDIMFSFDNQLIVKSVSPNVERILGYRPEDLIGKPFSELPILHPDDIHEAVDMAHYIIAAGAATPTIFRFMTTGGEKRFGEVTGIPLLRDGRVAEVINVARDITKHVETENAYRTAADSYLNILKALPGGVSVLNAGDGRFVYANEAFCTVTGYALREILGKTPSDLDLPVEPEELGRCIGKAISGQAAGSTAVRFRKKDGTAVSLLVILRPVTYGGEDCVLMVAADAGA